MDVNRAIKIAVASGKVCFGYKEALKSVNKKIAQLIIVANNFPYETFKNSKYKDTYVYHFEGNNIELGNACGKPFGISVLTIIEPGNSNILMLRES